MTSDATQKKILDAARKVFVQKGLDGARMQEIANEAGINKALLHYHFRNKQQLFDAIFEEIFFDFIPRIVKVFEDDRPLVQRIEQLVEEYHSMIRRNPLAPQFILQEINRNPGKVVELFRNRGLQPEYVGDFLSRELKNAELGEFGVQHLITNILGMTLFPFISRPILVPLFFNGDEEKYEQFLEERKSVIPMFIEKSM